MAVQRVDTPMASEKSIHVTITDYAKSYPDRDIVIASSDPKTFLNFYFKGGYTTGLIELPTMKVEAALKLRDLLNELYPQEKKVSIVELFEDIINTVRNLEVAVENLRKDQDELETDVKDLDQTVSDQKYEIESLESQINDLSEDLGRKADESSVSDQLSDLDNRIEELENPTNAATGSTVEDLENRLDNLEEDLEALKNILRNV